MDNKIEMLFSKFKELDLSHMLYEDDEFTLELSSGKKEENVQTPDNKPANTINEIDNANINEEIKPVSNDDTVDLIDNQNEESNPKDNAMEIKSPLVGTFYRKMDPDSDDLVKIGQEVSKDDVVCVIEAMKMYNEITSPYDGIVKEINFKDGDFVEFDDILIVIE